MKIAILDMGTRNSAMIVEYVPNKAINKLITDYSILSDKEKIKEGRPHSEPVKKILKEFTTQGQTVFLELFDPNEGESAGLTNTTRKNLFVFLEKNKKILSRCDHVAIEEQFYDPKHGVINKPALQLGESAYAWLLLNVNSDISYTPSKYKTALLACPKETLMVDKATGLRIMTKWGKPQRKKWSVERALEIYRARGDTIREKYILERKGDDVSDCLLMSVAFLLKEYAM